VSAQLNTAYRAIVADLGRWAEAFGLRSDAEVSATGSTSTESPSFVMGNVSVYRADDEGQIHVHQRVAGVAGEVVFMLRPRLGQDAELVGEVFLYDTQAPDHCAN